jgi:hypothetical protein
MIAPPRALRRRLISRPSAPGSAVLAAWAGRTPHILASDLASTSAALVLVSKRYLTSPGAASEIIAASVRNNPTSALAAFPLALNLPAPIQDHLTLGVLLAAASGTHVPVLDNPFVFGTRSRKDITPTLALLIASLAPPETLAGKFFTTPPESGGIRAGEGSVLAELLLEYRPHDRPAPYGSHSWYPAALARLIHFWAREPYSQPLSPPARAEAAALCRTITERRPPELLEHLKRLTTPDVVPGLLALNRRTDRSDPHSLAPLETELVKAHLALVSCPAPGCALTHDADPLVEAFTTLASEHQIDSRRELLDLLAASHVVICPSPATSTPAQVP